MNPIPDTQPILGTAGMREADRRTIEDHGLPGAVLMEAAGRAVGATILGRWGRQHLSDPDDRSARTTLPPLEVVVACGQGNNGGDGFVVARVLHAVGVRVHVLLAGDPGRHSPETRIHFQALEHLVGTDLRLTRISAAEDLQGLDPGDVLVDALLGIGQSALPRAPLDAIVEWMNRSGRPIVAVDIATGLDSDSGRTYEPAIRASVTVTMAAAKIGHCLADGPAASGDLITAEIGIPETIVREEAAASGVFRTTDRAVRRLLAPWPRTGHKYTSGPAFVVGGSLKYPGAPVLASRAAGRAGCGYVVCHAPDAASGLIAPALVDVPYVGLPSTPGGTVDGERAADAVLEGADRVRALLVGPGLGRNDGVTAFVRRLLSRWTGPVVVDADGLYALNPPFLRSLSGGPVILTPHAAEFERLGGAIDESIPSPMRAHAAAREWGTIVLLKGFPSVVAAGDAAPVVCSSGNPALAAAGTGDVLAGLCVGLLARGLEPFHVAVAALHLGGAAADRYASRCGRSTLMASDLLRELGPLVRERFE